MQLMALIFILLFSSAPIFALTSRTTLDREMMTYAQNEQALKSAVGPQAMEVLGRSLLEKKIRWFWIHQKYFLNVCLADAQNCGGHPEFKNLIQMLHKLHVQGATSQLQFLRENEASGLFTSVSGETHRVAVTGLTPDSKIYFNLDQAEKLSLHDLLAVLIHELSHHLGLKDDESRTPDRLGLFLSRYIMSHATVLKTDNASAFGQAMLFDFSKGDRFEIRRSPYLGLIMDSVALYDLDLLRIPAAFYSDGACDRNYILLNSQRLHSPRLEKLANGARFSVVVHDECSKTFPFKGAKAFERFYTLELPADDNGNFVRSQLSQTLGPAQENNPQLSKVLVKSWNISKKVFNPRDTGELRIEFKNIALPALNSCEIHFKALNSAADFFSTCEVQFSPDLRDISLTVSFTVPTTVGDEIYTFDEVEFKDTKQTFKVSLLNAQIGFQSSSIEARALEILTTRIVEPDQSFDNLDLSSTYENPYAYFNVFLRPHPIAIEFEVHSPTPPRLQAIGFCNLVSGASNIWPQTHFENIALGGPLDIRQSVKAAGPQRWKLLLEIVPPYYWAKLVLNGFQIQSVVLAGEDEALRVIKTPADSLFFVRRDVLIDQPLFYKQCQSLPPVN